MWGGGAAVGTAWLCARVCRRAVSERTASRVKCAAADDQDGLTRHIMPYICDTTCLRLPLSLRSPTPPPPPPSHTSSRLRPCRPTEPCTATHHGQSHAAVAEHRIGQQLGCCSDCDARAVVQLIHSALWEPRGPGSKGAVEDDDDANQRIQKIEDACMRTHVGKQHE